MELKSQLYQIVNALLSVPPSCVTRFTRAVSPAGSMSTRTRSRNGKASFSREQRARSYERHRTGDERPQDSAALGPRSLVRRGYAGGEALLLEGCAAIARSAFSIEELPVVPSSKVTP